MPSRADAGATTTRIASLLALVLGCAAEPAPREAEAEAEPTRELARRDEPDPAPARAPARVREPEPDRQPACRLVDPPPGFVDLRERLPHVVIAAGYHHADNFTGARLPGYEAAGAWFDADAAAALRVAADELAAAGYGLIIYDAYRPRRASEAMVAWAEANDRDELLREGWVAARSLHNRGVAIDLGLTRIGEGSPDDLVDLVELVDMGSAWDHFGPTSRLRGVEGPALAQRLRLRDAMLAAGFEPYASEWWHFTWTGPHPAPRDEPYRCQP